MAPRPPAARNHPSSSFIILLLTEGPVQHAGAVSSFEESLRSRARSKTKLRTVRLPHTLDTALEEEAAKRGMTMNSFVVSILERYNEWDKLAEKFHFVSFPAELVREEYSAVRDLPTLKRFARQAGSKIPREMMLFWFKEINLESFLSYLSIQSKFQGFASYEIIHRNEKIIIIAKHELGPNWSAWLEEYLGEAIRSNLSVAPQTEVHDNSVKFEFRRPPA